MSTVTVEQALQMGLAQHRAGQLVEAESIYRHIIAAYPGQPDAWHFLGLLAQQIGRHDLAAEHIARAIHEGPASAEMHANLGESHRLLGHWEEACACYARALALKPAWPETRNSLALVLYARGLLDEAQPHCERALALRPDFPEAHNNLGNILLARNRLDEARAHYERALTLRPDYLDARGNLGALCNAQGRHDEAQTHCRRVLAGEPDGMEAHHNLAVALQALGHLDEALEHANRTLALVPALAVGHSNLGNILRESGRIDEALASCQRALDLQPGLVSCHTNLINTLHYHPAASTRLIADECRRWNGLYAAPLRPFIYPHDRRPDPVRRLRVGFVSADFRVHPASYFLVPLFAAHDLERLEFHGYSSVLQPDGITGRLEALAAGWRDVRTLSDEALAAQIRADGIDILVDLSLHTAGHRLLTFARKPAPVQVSWLGYAGFTCLETMDGRLTDPFIDPPGAGDGGGRIEAPVRLPDCWCCYDPLADLPPATPLPALENGGALTFGSLNNFCKLNDAVLRLWARLLGAVPGSRLLLHAPTGGARQRVMSILAASGLDPAVLAGRVEFVGRQNREDYLCTYGRVDVGLDPFPFNGMTTTCEALYMGVPVLTLAGELPVSRAGLSLLHTVGLDKEFAAESEEDYIARAVALAADLPRLGIIRAGLRERLQASPLMDAPRFARHFEAVCRDLWRQWCAAQPNAAPAGATGK